MTKVNVWKWQECLYILYDLLTKLCCNLKMQSGFIYSCMLSSLSFVYLLY